MKEKGQQLMDLSQSQDAYWAEHDGRMSEAVARIREPQGIVQEKFAAHEESVRTLAQGRASRQAAGAKFEEGLNTFIMHALPRRIS